LHISAFSGLFGQTFGILPLEEAVYDDKSFLVRFDDSMTEAEIDILMDDLQCMEHWVSPLTSTRKWEVIADAFPIWYEPDGEWLADIQNVKKKGNNRAGGDTKTGYNYQFPIDGNGSQPPSEDDQMDCNSEVSSHILTGGSQVKVGIFDTGGAKNYFETQNWFWHFGNGNGEGIDYVNQTDWPTDDNGHGDHIASTIYHLVNKSFGQGESDKPNVETGIYKVFDQE